ncbi:DgyrCDS10823 [Dimorphilus gyrociliatus]|uniref:DgyrCDS10823 n=1 Tax=Dimorphilus gyrociliatus TaxID=2664684 RepID=A0A7I8W1E4_9ANNE|nr:DgyrCDS10823 [Dimorphilus gyrociliatus]
MNNVQALAKAGAIGICSIITCCFGFFFIIPGIALTASSNDEHFDSDFFEESNRGMRVAGGVLLALGILCAIVGVTMCCFACKAIKSKQAQPGVIITQGPTISGQGPQGPVYTQQQYAQYHYGQPGLPPQQYGEQIPPQSMPPPSGVPPHPGMPPQPNNYSNPYQQPPPFNPEYNNQPVGQPPQYNDIMKQ